MNLITAMAGEIKRNHKQDWFIFLSIQKCLVEKHFDWLSLYIDTENKTLLGQGDLNCNGKKNKILLQYSPFNKYRYDRIYISDKSIMFNDDIHLYGDLSLCLYHPLIDQPLLQIIPLFKMIPWIGEWLIFYEQWKKYGVWFGNEIRHR